MSRKITSEDAGPAVKALDAYHHGDLRQALIAAARRALETSSPEEITLKSLALRLGVSQPAPYRHFNNREALLAAVAADGFERFRAALAEAAATAPPGEAFVRSAMAYIEFGRANRGVYRLMFASPVLATQGDDRELEQAGSAAFTFLLDRVATVAAADRVYPTAVWIWSTLHGMVMLESVGLLSGPVQDRVSAEAIVRQMAASLSV